jgi:hypothetical protein
MLDFIGNKLRVASFRLRIRFVAGLMRAFRGLRIGLLVAVHDLFPPKFGPRENL